MFKNTRLGTKMTKGFVSELNTPSVSGRAGRPGQTTEHAAGIEQLGAAANLRAHPRGSSLKAQRGHSAPSADASPPSSKALPYI